MAGNNDTVVKINCDTDNDFISGFFIPTGNMYQKIQGCMHQEKVNLNINYCPLD